MNQRKRGKLSLEEERFILENNGKLSTIEIAQAINRTEEPVLRFLRQQSLISPDEKNAVETLRCKLHASAYWPEIVAQFSANECQYFEDMWLLFMKQFREDVLPTEEMEIKNWLTLDILLSRSMKDRKKNAEEVDRLQTLIDKEYLKPVDQRDTQLLVELETNISTVRNSITAYTREHTQLLSQIRDIRQALKAARADRIKRLEDGQTSWHGLLKQLEESDERERQGQEAEVLARATEKIKKKYIELHTFADGKIDRPFLTPETINGEDFSTNTGASSA